jgi:hypothetical protein
VMLMMLLMFGTFKTDQNKMCNLLFVLVVL